jgi:hypothetical protein
MTVFEEKYKDDLALEGAIALGMEAMTKAGEGKVKPETVEIGLVQQGEKPFERPVIQTVGAAGNEAVLLLVPGGDHAGAAAEGLSGVSEDHGQCGPEVGLVQQSI